MVSTDARTTSESLKRASAPASSKKASAVTPKTFRTASAKSAAKDPAKGLTKTYCPSCGSIVLPGAVNCPQCGMRVKAKPVQARKKIELPSLDAEDAPSSEKTSRLARLESALPAEQDIHDPYHHENPLRLKSVLVASAAALLLCGTAILLITHPWDPHAFDTKAQTPADTSQEGFPGVVSDLKGQDSDKNKTDGQEVVSTAEATYKTLQESYQKLGDLNKDVDSSIQDLETYGFAGDKNLISDKAATAQKTALAISNVISDVQSLEVADTTYAAAQQDLVKMGNYLRNKNDTVVSAYKKVLQSANPAAEKEKILQPIKTTAANYGNLFNQAYAAFSISAP